MRLATLSPTLAGLIAVATSTSATSPLAGRQFLNSLEIFFGSDGSPVYLSNENFTCDSYSIGVAGFFPPFELATVESPYNPDDVAGQKAKVIGNVTREAWVDWIPDLPLGEVFAIRVRDTQGNVRYSGEHEMKVPSGTNLQCKNLHPKGWDAHSAAQQFGTWFSCISGGAFLIGMVCMYFAVRRRARTAAAAAAAAAATVTPVVVPPTAEVQQPQQIEIVVIPNVRMRGDSPPPSYGGEYDK
ncbi:hypothetical protein JCM10213_008495 [Rhodosporidiobolus nylandii]